LKPDVYNLASNVAEKHGTRAGAEIAEFEVANLEAVRDYVRATGAECDFTITQAVDVQLSQQHNTALKARYDKFISDGGDIAKSAFYIDGKDAEMISGVKGAKGAYKYTAGHVWPYKMIHHMFTEALTYDNVNLQTNTPVISVSSIPDAHGRWTVTTARGSVSAGQVVMATNAYTSALLPEYRDKIIPYRGICSRIVTPGPAKPPLLANTYALRFNSWDFDYLIPRNDGSIVVGGARRTYLHHLDDWYGNVDDTQLIERAKGYFDGYMQRHFRGWEDSGAYTDRVWTGSKLTQIANTASVLLPYLVIQMLTITTNLKSWATRQTRCPESATSQAARICSSRAASPVTACPKSSLLQRG
jgi:glycine/D-amino acid oxidase-like deaminating enzyme